MNNTKLKLGYCCFNTELRQQGIFTSRTCRLATLQKKGIEYSYELATNNLQDLEKIIEWNYKNNINVFRMSSEMFPFASHPDYYQMYNLDQFRDTLVKIGKLAKKYKQRLTFHPSQYNQLSSLRQSVIDKAIIDIDFHAKVLDMMKINKNGVIVIHGGGKQGGKEVALERFENSFKKLSKSSQKRLVLENCEMAYSIEDLLPLCEKLKIPLVLDYHHHNINPGTITNDLLKYSERIIKIWQRRKVIPLFHVSESREGVLVTDNIMKRRAHSDFVKQLPTELLELAKNTEVHVDIEAKMKEQAVLQLYEIYFVKNNDK
jgi:UV damage endonuclease UvdE